MATLRDQAARLAQSVEHQTFNLRVRGSSPLMGWTLFFIYFMGKLFQMHVYQTYESYTKQIGTAGVIQR